MKFLGQYIQDFVSRFRNDVYLEDISTGTIASGGNLGLDSNNKIVKADVPADGDITGISFRPDDANTVGFTSGSADFVLVGSTGIKTTGDGSSTLTLAVDFADDEQATFGVNNDLKIYHNSSLSRNIIDNDVGDLYINQNADDKDIVFRCDDGSGGTATYFTIDGSDERNLFSKKVRIDHDVSDASVASIGLDIDMDVTGSDALSSDVTQKGINVDVRSTATGGDTSDEHRLTGIYSRARTAGSGDADNVVGVYGLAESDRSSSATTSIMRGVQGIAYANDSAAATSADIRGGDFSCYINTDGPDVTSMYGVLSTAYTNTNSTDNVSSASGLYGKAESRGSGTITTANAVYGEIEVDAGTITTGNCFRAVVDHNGGTLTTAFMYRGTTSGTVGTLWGIHLDGEDKNYFSGNVGIGTTSPGNKLEVHSGTTNVAAVFKSSDNQAWISVHDDDSGTYGALFGTDSDEGHHIVLADRSANKRLVVDSSGNVGIGVTSPDVKFHVSGDTKFDNAYVLDSIKHSGDSDTQIKFTTDTIGFDTAGSERLTIKSDGDVGIGTTSPGEKLEVSGNIKLSGNLDIGGSVQKQIQVFPMNFVDDLGTTKHFMPFVTNTEQTVNYQEEAAMVMPADGRVVSVTVHYAQMHGSDGNITVGIETSPCGQSYTNTWDIEETETIAASVADDHHVFHFAFDNAKHFESTDKMAISIQQSTAMQNASRFFWVTAVVEYDWSTFLGGTSAEHTTTP